MKKFLCLLGFLLILGVASQVSAASIPLTNDGFESGNLTGWDSENTTVASESSYQHFGTHYAEITGTTKAIYNVETSPGFFNSVSGYGGYISQTISYNDRDTYSFDWLFLFSDGHAYDYAYYKIDGVEEVFYTKGFDTNPPVDWTTETITFSGTGTDVEFEIGVVSFNSHSYSQLFIDAAPVPVPSSLLLLGAGLFTISRIPRKEW